MDDERKKWAKKLNNLIRRNVQLTETNTRLLQQTPDGILQDLLKNQIHYAGKFRLELEEEIQNLNFDLISFKSPIIFTAFRGRYLNTIGKDVHLLVRYSIKQKKTILRLYQKALSQINEGSVREKLMRHMAYLEEELLNFSLYDASIRNQRDLENPVLSGK